MPLNKETKLNCYCNLRSSLLRCSTRPNEWGTQWDSNSLLQVCYSSLQTITLPEVPFYTTRGAFLLYPRCPFTLPGVPFYTTRGALLHYPGCPFTLPVVPFYSTRGALLHYPRCPFTLPGVPFYSTRGALLHYPRCPFTLPEVPFYSTRGALLHYPRCPFTLPEVPFYTTRGAQTKLLFSFNLAWLKTYWDPPQYFFNHRQIRISNLLIDFI